MKRFLCLGAVLSACLCWAGCGEIFRPVIIPNPPQFPSPAAVHSILTLSNNGTPNTGVGVPPETPLDGSMMVIDVSGDSVVSIKPVGLNPVHGVMQSATQALVVNQAVTGLPTPASGCIVTIGSQGFNVCPTLTRLVFSGTFINSVTTITLPTNSAANFVATTEANQAYVSLPNLFLDPLNHPNNGTVALVDTTTNTIPAEIMVGNNPTAMAETPDGTKVYIANQGDGTISAINTKDDSARQVCVNGTCPVAPDYAPIPLASPPIWISARSDNQRVYVLESNGTLAYVDTSTTAGPDMLYDNYAQTVQVAGATRMWYDVILNRLYIPGGTGAAIVDVSQSIPQDQVFPGGTFPVIATVPPSQRFRSDPCSRTDAPSTVSVVAATSLPDGSRSYIGSYYSDGSGNICPQVTVIDTTNNDIKTAMAVPGFPDATITSSPYYSPACVGARFRFNMAAGGDSSRVYLTSCDGGNVSIIYTSSDSFAESADAPASARSPIPPSTQAPPQSPVFAFAGP